MPLYHWRDAYDPYSSDRLLFGREHPYDFALAEKEKGRMLRVWVRVAAANLPVVITHQLKVSSVTWRVQEPPDGYTYCIPFTIVPNPYGLVDQPILPGLRKCLQEFLRTATGSQWNWLFFRPALFLYLVLFLGLVASFKNRDGRLLLVALPVFADWSCYLGAVFAQDVRYFSSLFFTWPFLAAFYLLCTLRAAPLP